MAEDASQFYTGLVAELYSPLRSAVPDAPYYERFIRRTGEPALELGCGDGDPMLALMSLGLEVEGLDSSADMIDRARARAGEMGIDAVLHLADMRDFALGRTYRSIYLAGPSFNLLLTDDDAGAALRCIHDHLAPEGRALVPLFVPDPPSTDGVPAPTTQALDGGGTISCQVVDVQRDETERTQMTRLLYRRETDEGTTELERPWVLHWYTPQAFADLAAQADLIPLSCRDLTGAPATEDSTYFVATLARADTA